MVAELFILEKAAEKLVGAGHARERFDRGHGPLQRVPGQKFFGQVPGQKFFGQVPGQKFFGRVPGYKFHRQMAHPMRFLGS
jgi:hypothetical protein